MDIWTSWIFGHHGYLDITDIRTSRIFGHHGYFDITDMRTSWIFGHHGCPDITDVRTSWIFGHHGHLDIMDMRTLFQMCKILHINIRNIAGRRFLRTFPSCWNYFMQFAFHFNPHPCHTQLPAKNSRGFCFSQSGAKNCHACWRRKQ